MVDFLQALKIGTSLPRTAHTRKNTIFESYGCVLSEDIIATKPLPPFDNSAMDGYAIKLEDYDKPCICDGIILAGDNAANLELQAGHTYKVMTGAMLPKGSEAVVQIEMAQDLGAKVIFECQEPKKGQNIRFQGEEITLDSVLLRKGKRLNHLDLSIIASQGIDTICTYAPLRVAIFSSGDEVIEPHLTAAPHQIYNTNATSLYTLLQSRGYECNYGGILPDNESALKLALARFSEYDVVITSGGASVGDADLIKNVLESMGATFLFDGVNLKPGRHLACATLGDTIIILLPGNPLALLLHTHTLILSFLESMQGSRNFYPKPISLKLVGEYHLKINTTSMILGKIEHNNFILYKGGKIGSSSLVNMWKNSGIAICKAGAHKTLCQDSNTSQIKEIYGLGQGGCIKVIPYNADFCDIIDFINYEIL